MHYDGYHLPFYNPLESGESDGKLVFGAVPNSLCYTFSDTTHANMERSYFKIAWLFIEILRRISSLKILETERLFIREFTEDDITNMHKIYSNPNVMQFIGDGLPFCFKQTSAFIQKMVQRYKRDGFSFWAVLNKKNGEILGHCGLMKHRESQKVEIGYLIQESSQKQGFAFEVSQAVLYYAFHNLSLQEVVAFTKWNNLPSQNLMKKLGMKHWKNYFKDGIEYTAYSITKDYYFEIGH